jgi:2-dehydropantoate 2-reductase
MKESDLSILVVGAGAVGGITAALLKKDGYDVEIVCKYDDYAKLISEKGINVSGTCGKFNVKMKAYPSVSDVKEQKDLILLATKANDMIKAAESVKGILKNEGHLISLQNGLCEEELDSVIGNNRVIGCVTGWGATMVSRGNLIMTSVGDFIIGYPQKESDEFLANLTIILSSVVPVRTTDNITGHLYSKLIINSCISSLGNICGLYLGKMLLIHKIRRIFIEIIREAVNVADKMGIEIEVFGGKLDFRKFLDGKGILSDTRRHLMIIIIGLKYRRLKSSGLQSLERGKETEVDYLNGYIVKNGTLHGVAMPFNELIVRLTHEIEKKERKISIKNFDDTNLN